MNPYELNSRGQTTFSVLGREKISELSDVEKKMKDCKYGIEGLSKGWKTLTENQPFFRVQRLGCGANQPTL